MRDAAFQVRPATEIYAAAECLSQRVVLRLTVSLLAASYGILASRERLKQPLIA